MRELNEHNGTKAKDTKDMFEIVETANFQKIKEGFFCTYPEFGNRTENRPYRINEILANSAKRAEKRAEAANNTVSA